MIGKRATRAGSPDADADRVAQLEQRVAELEQVVAALARYAARNGAAEIIYALPFGRVIDNHADAVLIRRAARRPAEG